MKFHNCTCYMHVYVSSGAVFSTNEKGRAELTDFTVNVGLYRASIRPLALHFEDYRLRALPRFLLLEKTS